MLHSDAFLTELIFFWFALCGILMSICQNLCNYVNYEKKLEWTETNLKVNMQMTALFYLVILLHIRNSGIVLLNHPHAQEIPF